MNRIVCLFLLAFVFFSCRKEKETPTSGSITLSSELVLSGQYIIRGFSFSEASFLNFPGTAPAKVDLVAFSTRDSIGNINGAGLYCPSNEDSAFWLAAGFDNLPQATTFFDELDTLPLTRFLPLVNEVHPNEIWVIRTGTGSYAKILFRDVRVIDDAEGDYTELDLDWVFQPDGTRIF
ncbi:MAG: hypothetical protein U0T82_00495 [Bacteroidales bacterium]